MPRAAKPMGVAGSVLDRVMESFSSQGNRTSSHIDRRNRPTTRWILAASQRRACRRRDDALRGASVQLRFAKGKMWGHGTTLLHCCQGHELGLARMRAVGADAGMFHGFARR